MQFTVEYTWLESYLNHDSLWLEDSINWDDIFDLITIDYNIYSFIITSWFLNSHFFLDSITKLSFLDILFLSESNLNNSSRELFDYVMWDLISFLYNSFLPTQLLFFTDYQDFIVLILHHSPELKKAIKYSKNSDKVDIKESWKISNTAEGLTPIVEFNQ
jgi:hypothetical protein